MGDEEPAGEDAPPPAGEGEGDEPGGEVDEETLNKVSALMTRCCALCPLGRLSTFFPL